MRDAWQRSAKARARFEASQVLLTVEVVARRSSTQGEEIGWWIAEAGVDRW